MTSFLRNCVLPRNGRLGGSCPAMSPRLCDSGRRLCFPPCADVSLKWRASAGPVVQQADKAYSNGRSGACPHCDDFVVGALHRQVMNNHLELGQLWSWSGALCGMDQWGSVWTTCVVNTTELSSWLGKFPPPPPHGLFPVNSGKPPYDRMFPGWRWMLNCFRNLAADMFTNTGFTGVANPRREGNQWKQLLVTVKSFIQQAFREFLVSPALIRNYKTVISISFI